MAMWPNAGGFSSNYAVAECKIPINRSHWDFRILGNFALFIYPFISYIPDVECTAIRMPNMSLPHLQDVTLGRRGMI